jgi:hypothetical protein
MGNDSVKPHLASQGSDYHGLSARQTQRATIQLVQLEKEESCPSLILSDRSVTTTMNQSSFFSSLLDPTTIRLYSDQVQRGYRNGKSLLPEANKKPPEVQSLEPGHQNG